MQLTQDQGHHAIRVLEALSERFLKVNLKSLEPLLTFVGETPLPQRDRAVRETL